MYNKQSKRVANSRQGNTKQKASLRTQSKQSKKQRNIPIKSGLDAESQHLAKR